VGIWSKCALFPSGVQPRVRKHLKTVNDPGLQARVVDTCWRACHIAPMALATSFDVGHHVSMVSKTAHHRLSFVVDDERTVRAGKCRGVALELQRHARGGSIG
jgi:hypothetical protein